MQNLKRVIDHICLQNMTCEEEYVVKIANLWLSSQMLGR